MFDDSIKDGLQNLYARNSDEFRRQARSMQQPGEKIVRLQLLHICSNCQFYALVSMVNLVNTIYSSFRLCTQKRESF